ncbi:unnamed protein product [Dibothriocephalus latus]|uniref:Uncharacterized protein n=1 Tax=Dibothriocephalus latus TaxID=60516 RepID=A0A3P7P4R5_DIBLA|nr:unnamed protein product [Dibothriocephalus latus]
MNHYLGSNAYAYHGWQNNQVNLGAGTLRDTTTASFHAGSRGQQQQPPGFRQKDYGSSLRIHSSASSTHDYRFAQTQTDCKITRRSHNRSLLSALPSVYFRQGGKFTQDKTMCTEARRGQKVCLVLGRR